MNKSSDLRSRETRGRLLDAAMHLFASKGVASTTVGEIEAAAGLAPRSGALYKYFDSKSALLAAGLERHLGTVHDLSAELALQPLGDVRSECLLLGRWLLRELEVERDITHILEREGEHLGDLRDRMRRGVSDRGYLIGADVLGRWLSHLAQRERERLAVVAVGALINFKRSTWTLGAPPLSLNDDEFVETWAEVFVTVISQHAVGC